MCIRDSIWGDCSSPEIVKQTIRALDKVAEKYGHTFHYTDAAMGLSLIHI